VWLASDASAPPARDPVLRRIRALSVGATDEDAGRLLPILIERQVSALWASMTLVHAHLEYLPHVNIDFPFSGRSPARDRARLARLADQLVTRHES
jgi:hypothetical protein